MREEWKVAETLERWGHEPRGQACKAANRGVRHAKLHTAGSGMQNCKLHTVHQAPQGPVGYQFLAEMAGRG